MRADASLMRIVATWRRFEPFPVYSHCRLHGFPCCWHILRRWPDDSRV